jgi:hypothetical protein
MLGKAADAEKVIIVFCIRSIRFVNLSFLFFSLSSMPSVLETLKTCGTPMLPSQANRIYQG